MWYMFFILPHREGTEQKQWLSQTSCHSVYLSQLPLNSHSVVIPRPISPTPESKLVFCQLDRTLDWVPCREQIFSSFTFYRSIQWESLEFPEKTQVVIWSTCTNGIENFIQIQNFKSEPNLICIKVSNYYCFEWCVLSFLLSCTYIIA